MERPRRGDTRISYSELLRVLGSDVEQAHLSEVRIFEAEDSFILQGLVMEGEHSGERSTYQLTAEDISELWEDALQKRTRKK